MKNLNFKQRRESILSVFKNAVDELNGLNAEINEEIKENELTVTTLQVQNKELNSLKTSNDKTISFFSKMFKQ